MIVIGALLIVMFFSSVLVISACILAGQSAREIKQMDGLALEISGQWSGTSFGGRYITRVPHCSFEPEDLEEIQAQVVRQF